MNIECEICKKIYKDFRGFYSHISKSHQLTSKQYYDIYLKKEKENYCKICNKETTFINGRIGYHRYCSPKCASSDIELQNSIKKTMMLRYGVKNIFHKSDYIKQCCLNKLGVDSAMKLEATKQKIKQKFLIKYGVDNPNKLESVKRKKIETYLDRYGVESQNQIKEVKYKKKITCLKNFGVESPLQSKDIQSKYKATSLLKFGVDNVFKLKDKIEQSRIDSFGSENYAKTFKGRQICRENAIRLVEIQKLNNEPLGPRIGINERECLNELQKFSSFQIKKNQKIIGYFPDGYIEELKLIIEFDERYHFKDNYLTYSERDIQKDKDYLNIGLKIFRIKENEWNENPLNIIHQFKKLIETKD